MSTSLPLEINPFEAVNSSSKNKSGSASGVSTSASTSISAIVSASTGVSASTSISASVSATTSASTSASTTSSSSSGISSVIDDTNNIIDPTTNNDMNTIETSITNGKKRKGTVSAKVGAKKVPDLITIIMYFKLIFEIEISDNTQTNKYMNRIFSCFNIEN
jgi:hypothetical protein